MAVYGGPLVGVRKYFVSLLEKHMKEAGFQNQITKIHCIIQQKKLCFKALEMQEVMHIVFKLDNLSLSKALKHRQFQQLLLEVDS